MLMADCVQCGCAAAEGDAAHRIVAALIVDDLDGAIDAGLLDAIECNACTPACRATLAHARDERQRAQRDRRRARHHQRAQGSPGVHRRSSRTRFACAWTLVSPTCGSCGNQCVRLRQSHGHALNGRYAVWGIKRRVIWSGLCCTASTPLRKAAVTWGEKPCSGIR